MRKPQSLQQWMERHGVNQTELAKRARMPQSQLSQLLSGSRRCSLAKALDLHEVTGVPVEKLVAWPKSPVTRIGRQVSDIRTGNAQ